MTEPEPQPQPQPRPAAPPPPAGPSPTASPAAKSNAHLIGPVGLVIAGLLGLIGGLLPWVSISVSAGGGASQSIQGSSMAGSPAGSDGTAFAVVLGTLILICAAVYLFGVRNRRLLGLTAVLSLVLLGLGVFKIIDVYRQANDFYDRMSNLVGTLPGPAGPGGSLNFRDLFHIDPAPGLWMVAIGGLMGTVLSLFVWGRSKPPAPVAPVATSPDYPSPH